jgi:hypothetical protein
MTEGGRLKEIAFDLYERYILLEHIGKLFRPARVHVQRPGCRRAYARVLARIFVFSRGFDSGREGDGRGHRIMFAG